MIFLSAIRLVQNVQLVCFAVVFLCMVLQSPRDNRLRWLLCNYVLGAIGAVFAWKALHPPALPAYLLGFEIPQLRYACLHLAVVSFVQRGKRTRWLSLLLPLACLPVYLLGNGTAVQMQQYNALALGLAIQTIWTAWLLLQSREEMTRWPRSLMGGFLVLYAAMEAARIAVTLHTGHSPAQAAPLLDEFSIDMFVVASTLTPLAFIWMMNSRLLADLKTQIVLDPLTGLLNRRGFQAVFERVLARYETTGENFALAVADLDHFKSINDTYGHVEGDAVLCATADLLRRNLRSTDFIGRLGGEEFVILLCDAQPDEALELIERTRQALAQSAIPIDGGLIQVTASFGLTTPTVGGCLTLTRLLHEADSAMYEAKAQGRNRTRVQDHVFVAPQSLRIGCDGHSRIVATTS